MKGNIFQHICSWKNTADFSPFSDKPTFTTYPRNQTVREGDNVTLLCDATGNPKPTISWTIDGLTVNITVHPRIGLSSDNKQLTVSNVNRTDLSHEYRCQANNSVGTITSDAASLNVQCEYDWLIRYSYIIYWRFHPLSCFDCVITRSTWLPNSYHLVSIVQWFDVLFLPRSSAFHRVSDVSRYVRQN